MIGQVGVQEIFTRNMSVHFSSKYNIEVMRFIRFKKS